jgi:hypothetical protein
MLDPKKPKEDLTQAQIAALPLLAAGTLKKDAASTAGVTPQTISEWLRLPRFRAALHSKRQELNAVVADRLSEGIGVAVNTVLELAKSGSESVRLKAAIFAIERLLAAPPDPHAGIWGELAEAEAWADKEAMLRAQRMRELLDKIRERAASGYYRKLAEADQNQSYSDSSPGGADEDRA